MGLSMYGGPYGHTKNNLKLNQEQWGWDITGQRITGQSCPDWLKMTSSRTSKPESGGLSRF